MPNPMPTNPIEIPEGSPVSRLREKSEALKRGSKAGVKRGPYKTDKPEGNVQGASSPQTAAPQAPAFNPENFKRVIGLPNSYMEFHTGVAGWAFTPDELTELAINGVPAFNETIPIAPKWVHWTLFLISYISIMSIKILGYLAYLRDLARQRIQADKSKSNPTEPAQVSTPGPEISGVGPLKVTKTPPMS